MTNQFHSATLKLRAATINQFSQSLSTNSIRAWRILTSLTSLCWALPAERVALVLKARIALSFNSIRNSDGTLEVMVKITRFRLSLPLLRKRSLKFILRPLLQSSSNSSQFALMEFPRRSTAQSRLSRISPKASDRARVFPFYGGGINFIHDPAFTAGLLAALS